MKFNISILFLALSFGCSKDPDMYIEYYGNGQIKFEVPLKNGKWHGTALGYFSTGELRGKMNVINNKREGYAYEYYQSGKVKQVTYFHDDIRMGEDKLYLQNGLLVEKTFFDSLGKPIDIHRYKNGKRDLSYQVPLVYTTPDTVNIGATVTLNAKLGNADSTIFDLGILLITSGFNKEKMPLDTLFIGESKNKEGFRYSFRAEKKGENYIHGALIFKDLHGSENLNRPYFFEYKFDVY
jgi:hypothetical protein